MTLLDLFSFDFMQRALVAALLTGLAAPAIGTFIVQRRLALLGDGIGHVAVTGVALGLLTAQPDATGRLWFAERELRTAARIQRLRAGLALNYAAIGLVLDLLNRIDDLQAALGGAVVVLAGTQVLGDAVDALHQHAVTGREDLQDLALLALVLAGDDLD